MNQPNFLLIGSARSGTTGLYHNLLQHPDIFMPVKKELHYFSHSYSKGIKWYKEQFKNAKNQKMVGEASVSYTYPEGNSVSQRIFNTLGPNVKFIYMVRNPIQRTISHYRYYKNYGLKEPLEFEEAIDKNPIYIGTSKYSEFINEYVKLFKKENFLIIVFEDYIKNTHAELCKIFNFLGIDNTFIPSDSMLKTNESFKARNALMYRIYFRLSQNNLRKYAESIIPQGKRKRTRNFLRKLLSKKQSDEISKYILNKLREELYPEIDKMESILNRNLDIWRDN